MNAQNRLFAIIAIGLVILLAIGLLGIGGWALVIRPRQRAAQAEIAATQVAMAATTTVTATATLLPPATATPLPTSTPVKAAVTNTPVVAPASPTAQPASQQPTDTPPASATEQPTAEASPTAAPETTTPQTGFGPGIAVLSAAGLSGLLIVSRRLRKTG